MGAVHDLGTLSSEGESFSEIAARYINKCVRLIFSDCIPDIPDRILCYDYNPMMHQLDLNQANCPKS